MSEKIDIEKVPFRKLYTGAVMPAMGLGTFGSDKYSPDQISEAVYGAVKAGYRMLDCASVYQNESQIGEVLERLFSEKIVSRKEMFITSKVWNDQHREVKKACSKSLSDLKLSYIDLYFVHWPFPNYHAPGCDGDSRNPDSKPFSVEEFMDTWKQCEELVDAGIVRAIGMSNMTVSKLEKVLPLCRIKPAALEMECHPSFQQQELFDYAVSHEIIPIGFCPIGSPSRPERDRTSEDVADTELEEVLTVAKNHDIHPAVVCLKWAVQRGMCPIPFSVKQPQYISNLKCTTQDPLTDEEMELLKKAERNCRLVKGQVFLWPGAEDWTQLWE
ncbi:aldo/keto reductase [Butyrivibrio sp. INlla16]|uniref:aldo/keto reductase family protein n=1 Tax=Butyrivibrio sp. INlla16 TaxID=1520807 RepID=UPI00087ECCCF|nr:aldo/keto reductase [Butyrivibrio sp. INlla16]SDB61133.1 Aldo/keto reductase [Butyrivibrio sp. INlla16]